MTDETKPQLVNQPSAAPTRKVLFGGLAGAVTAVIVWAAKQYGNVEIPSPVSESIGVIVGVVVAYFTRDRENVDI